MKRLFWGVVLLWVVVFSLPVMVMSLTNHRAEKIALPVAMPDSGKGDAITKGSFSEPYQITLCQTKTGEVLELDFEEYIAGVVAMELTPEFPINAIKAQAVAARSYTLSKVVTYLEQGIPESHHGALLCDDFSHCRSYTLIDTNEDETYIKSVRDAVEDTKGEYLTYENRVAKTYFHKISSGKTENVRDVWGVELPYLISVESPGDVRADGYKSRVFYPKEAFLTVIRGLRPELPLPDALKDGEQKSKKTVAGGVKEISIFGEKFSGKEIAEGFGLRSRSFSLEFRDNQAVFDVSGNGHGVGMSQWGAKFMAEEGKSYQEILSHYYPGVSLTQLYQIP